MFWAMWKFPVLKNFRQYFGAFLFSYGLSSVFFTDILFEKKQDTVTYVPRVAREIMRDHEDTRYFLFLLPDFMENIYESNYSERFSTTKRMNLSARLSISTLFLILSLVILGLYYTSRATVQKFMDSIKQPFSSAWSLIQPGLKNAILSEELGVKVWEDKLDTVIC